MNWIDKIVHAGCPALFQIYPASAMQTVRIIQAVILMTLLALAASCTVSRDFANRVFRPAPVSDSATRTIRFLETGNQPASDSGWVSTEAFRDSASYRSVPLTEANNNRRDSLARKEPLVTRAPESDPPPAVPDSRGVRQKRTRNQ